MNGPMPRDDPQRAGDQVTRRAVARLQKAHPALAVSVHTASGDPRALLVDMAADVAVLVLGSRGRGAVASLLLGSVSVALAAHAPCSVVVARPLSGDVASVDLSVVVGVDGTEASADAVRLGFELASSQFRPLQVVHALGTAWHSPYPDMFSPELVRQMVEAAELLLVESVAPYVEKFPDVVVHRRLVHETPTQALVTASEIASVVVVGCRSRGAVQRGLLGSVSRSVVEHAHSTVAVVRGAGT